MPNIKSAAQSIALAAVSLLSLGGAAHADDDYLSVNAGYYDVVRHKYPATQFGLEYRFSEVMYGLHPILGGMVTTDNEEYGYVGFNWDVALLPNQLFLVPNFSVGANSDGHGRQLGGTVEFRDGIELDYQLPNAQQIGIAFNHMSNAGIYNRNPGEESLLATYSVPIHTIAGLFSH